MIKIPRIGFIIIFLAVILLVVVVGQPMTYYRSGWEISTEMLALECLGGSQGSGGGANGQGGSNDKEFRPTLDIYKRRGASIKWDADDPAYGFPDIKATVSDVREETSKMPYETLEQDYQDYKYVIDYHEYLFDLQVRTIADVQETGEYVWIHETSFPDEWRENLASGGDRTGRSFDGGAYVRFSCLPWGMPDFEAPENYTFNGYWLGIMNAKVERSDKGVATPDIEITDKGWSRNIASTGAQLNMYLDDGEFGNSYAEVPWDITKVLDPDIKNVVVVYLPFELMAGAKHYHDVTKRAYRGAITELKPVDYYITYTVRMECLVIKEYEARDPSTPANPSPIEAPEDYVPATTTSFWDKYAMWIIIIIVGAVGFLIVFSLLSGMGLFGLLRTLFRFREDYRRIQL